LFVFEGDGVVKDYYGPYRDYRFEKSQINPKSEKNKLQTPVANERGVGSRQGAGDSRQLAVGSWQEAAGRRQLAGGRRQETGDGDQQPEIRKLSFNEKREYGLLEKEIEKLEAEKAGIEAKLQDGEIPYEELTMLSERIAEIMELLDEKMLRWMELDERK
jgi:ATP-binding cassette subfamily F protein uup